MLKNITSKMFFYLLKFIFRIAVFATIVFLYVKDKVKFFNYTIESVKNGINFMHFVWVVFMGLMISHLCPTKYHSMGAGKAMYSNYCPVPYSQDELMKFVRNENMKAWKSMIVWLGGNSIIAILYFCNVIGKPELLLLTGFYFLCDYICILIFCPFQTFGQKDRCCVNCRIYDWGHFFMFTPMLLIQTFYSLTLFAMSAIVIIRWEYMWTKYPERFWYGSNAALSCAGCKDRTCIIKKEVTKKITGR